MLQPHFQRELLVPKLLGGDDERAPARNFKYGVALPSHVLCFLFEQSIRAVFHHLQLIFYRIELGIDFVALIVGQDGPDLDSHCLETIFRGINRMDGSEANQAITKKKGSFQHSPQKTHLHLLDSGTTK